VSPLRCLAWLVALSSACFHPAFDRPRCGAARECPGGQVCASDGTCVPPVPPGTPDASAAPDAGEVPVDGPACYGTGIVRICLATLPSAPLAIAATTRIDTGDAGMCAQTISGADGYCVIAATSIAINTNVRVVGPKPLVFLASDMITSMAGTIVDAGSHHFAPGTPPDNGAGADPLGCAPGTPPSNGGGGAGGSFGGVGGNGGVGDNAGNGGVAGAATTAAELRGGCPGQDGEGAPADRGSRGHGGGAVFFLAASKIELAGNVLAAGGGGNQALRNAAGAGGGGSGGMIGFDAPTITVTGTLIANGGAGAEGASGNNAGRPGDDATSLTAAAGGRGGNLNGGDGGDGSAGAAAGSGGPGSKGFLGGGGGGGGGAGIVMAPAAAALGTKVSPAATR